jgi:hypothetical protein
MTTRKKLHGYYRCDGSDNYNRYERNVCVLEFPAAMNVVFNTIVVIAGVEPMVYTRF